MPEPSGFVAFKGEGNRLDGKKRKDSGLSEVTAKQVTEIIYYEDIIKMLLLQSICLNILFTDLCSWNTRL